MRIGIDTRLALRKRRGMGRVLLNIVTYLAMLDKDNQYILYLEKEDKEHILPSSKNFVKKLLPLRNYPLWEQFFLPFAALRDDLDILFCPANTAPACVPRRVKLLVTIHDVIFLKSRFEVPSSHSLYQEVGKLYRKICVESIKHRVNHVLTDSQFSKRDIQSELGILEDMITVIPNGVDDFFFEESGKDCKSVLANLGINFKFIFHLGGTTLNKNTIGAIQAYDLLVHKKEYEDVYLVIVGICPTRESEIIRFVKAHELTERIRFLNNISDEELRCLYSNAELFLFPSFYEGFGLPPLEAMACGTPVVVSNSTSLPEVVGEAGITVSPNKPYEIGEAMARVLGDEELRMKLIRAGRQRAESYRWENSVKLLLRVFEDLQRL